MKIIQLALLSTVFSLLSFTGKHNSISSPVTKSAITWKSTDIVIGNITQNKPVSIVFEFENTGETPVVITSVQASCGCTSTDYVKTPILPGKSATITAVFNAAAKGAFKKTVTVVTDAEESPRTLTFTGTVI